MKNSKHAKENKLNIAKIVCIIIIVIAVVVAIMYFITKGNTQNVIEENNIEETNTETTAVESNEISNETSSEKTTENDGVGAIVPPSPNDPIVNPEENRTDNENKAVELAKKYRGEDDSVYYTIDSKDGDVYNVVARNKETTAAVMFYTVNVATEEVKEQ